VFKKGLEILSEIFIVGWFLVTVIVFLFVAVLPLVILQPFVSAPEEWLRSVSMYDFLSTVGFGIWTLTGLAVIGLGLSIVSTTTYYKNDRRVGSTYIAGGAFFVLLLLAGKFI